MPSRTDAYISTALTHLPSHRQEQADRDLRATIAAHVAHRIGDGDTPEVAERAALETLGDPSAVALRYLHGHRALISPHLFSAWSLVTRWTCAIVLPCLYLVLVIVFAVTQDTLWITIFRPVGIVLTVGVYLVAAITALYALIDRQTAGSAPASRWSSDQLGTQGPRG